MADAMADALGRVNIETMQTERARQYIQYCQKVSGTLFSGSYYLYYLHTGQSLCDNTADNHTKE